MIEIETDVGMPEIGIETGIETGIDGEVVVETEKEEEVEIEIVKEKGKEAKAEIETERGIVGREAETEEDPVLEIEIGDQGAKLRATTNIMKASSPLF